MKTITDYRRGRQEQLHAIVVYVVNRCAAQARALPLAVHAPRATVRPQLSRWPMLVARGSCPCPITASGHPRVNRQRTS